MPRQKDLQYFSSINTIPPLIQASEEQEKKDDEVFHKRIVVRNIKSLFLLFYPTSFPPFLLFLGKEAKGSRVRSPTYSPKSLKPPISPTYKTEKNTTTQPHNKEENKKTPWSTEVQNPACDLYKYMHKLPADAAIGLSVRLSCPIRARENKILPTVQQGTLHCSARTMCCGVCVCVQMMNKQE